MPLHSVTSGGVGFENDQIGIAVVITTNWGRPLGKALNQPNVVRAVLVKIVTDDDDECFYYFKQ